MRAKLTILVLASAALMTATVFSASGGTVEADNGNSNNSDGSNDHLQIVDLDSRKDLAIVRCDGLIAQAEQITNELIVVTCNRPVDDNDRFKGSSKRKR